MAVRALDVVLMGPILLWAFLACAVPSHAQPASSGSADVVASIGADVGHREEMRDAYLPRTPRAPAVPPRWRTTWTVGPYTSVQVNVHEFGYNIPGDAANEPSIAVDPTDPSRLAIGWRQFDTIASDFRQAGWAYSRDGGHSWTFPAVLRPGEFSSDPVLDADLDGNFYYYSLQPDRGTADWSCYLYKSFDGGMTWPQDVYSRGGDKAWMAVDRTDGAGSGNIYFVWNVVYSCCGNTDFARSTNGGATTPPVQKLPEDLRWGTMSIGPDGELYVAGDGFYVAKSTNAQFPAETPEFDFVTYVNLGGPLWYGGGPNPGGLSGQAWVATDHTDGPNRGNVYLLASVNPSGSDPLDVNFARSTDGGVTWSAPVRINDDSPSNNAWQWFGTMSVAPNGRIDVIWNDTRNDPGGYDSELYYAWSEDAGETWAANVAVSPAFDPHLGWPQQNKIGDYYDMVSDDLGANLAYAATFNGEQDVYFLRIGAFDCNGNGVDDETDIAESTSEDCDTNGVPDECEPNEDCNSNGIQDICDIAAGTSEDCQPNRVPDECELAGNDCNVNGEPDECDIAGTTSVDCQPNSVPDECELLDDDCNGNDIPDDCDIAGATSEDCQSNGVPDECELLDNDCNSNGTPDDCDIADRFSIDCNTTGVPDDCEIRDGTSADCNDNGWPDECDAAACTSLWDGFQADPPFVPYGGVHGIDSDGDGVAWDNPLGSAIVRSPGCQEGELEPEETDQMIRATSPISDPETAYVTSEYFQTDDGELPPDVHAYALSFRARIDVNVDSKYDWEFFIYDALSGEAVVQLEFASHVGAAGDPGYVPGHILVNTGSLLYPQYADTGVSIELAACYDVEVVLDNTREENQVVEVYVDGALKVTTKRLQPDARRMDYFKLMPVNSSAAPDCLTRFILDKFDLCVTGVLVPPSVYDCNGNGQLDECDLAEGLAVDCDGDGVPDGCRIFGDFDGDIDVDLFDYADFRGCITGPGGGLGGGCEWGNFDCDDDIDLKDLAVFQEVFTGPLQ